MSKYKLWNSVIQGKSIAYDIDSNWEVPIDYIPLNSQLNNGNNLIGSNFVYESPNKLELKNPEIKKYSYNIFPSSFIIFVFSKKYPVNIEFRTKNTLIQDFDPNIPNLQFLEDIIIKGAKLKRIEKKELRIDNDESKLTDFELSFWNFLQNSEFKSFRDFLKGANTFKVPKSKSSIFIDKFDISGYSILNSFFSQNNFLNIIEKYKLKFFYGYIKSEDTTVDKFDYNTNELLLKPEYSKHFQNYWNPILLDEDNILCAYNDRYIKKNYLLSNHPNWKHNWGPNIEYKLDDVIFYFNNYFQCTLEHTSGLEFLRPYWKELTYLPNINWDDTSIFKFSYIKYKNEFYLAKTDNSFSQEPPGGDWLPLAIGNTNFIEDTSTNFYNKNIEQFSFVHFNNLFPDVIDYNNPLLIKLTSGYDTEDYASELEYQFQYDTNKPNRIGSFTTNVDNPNICFTDLTGILRFVNGKLFFYPSSRVYKITITDYNIDTNITTFDININGTNKSVERILPGITEESIDLKGQLYISDNFTFYVYLEEPVI